MNNEAQEKPSSNRETAQFNSMNIEFIDCSFKHNKAFRNGGAISFETQKKKKKKKKQLNLKTAYLIIMLHHQEEKEMQFTIENNDFNEQIKDDNHESIAIGINNTIEIMHSIIVGNLKIIILLLKLV